MQQDISYECASSGNFERISVSATAMVLQALKSTAVSGMAQICCCRAAAIPSVQPDQSIMTRFTLDTKAVQDGPAAKLSPTAHASDSCQDIKAAYGAGMPATLWIACMDCQPSSRVLLHRCTC